EVGAIVEASLSDAVAGQALTFGALHDLPGKLALSLRAKAAGPDVSGDARETVGALADNLADAVAMADAAASYAGQAQAEFERWGDLAASAR
ncbi:hypothetical protein NL489_27450, partial [Klebsiella pneumoniae]|nr:hypothetical protein [Klebsiella pneumoniae]